MESSYYLELCVLLFVSVIILSDVHLGIFRLSFFLRLSGSMIVGVYFCICIGLLSYWLVRGFAIVAD